MATKHSEGLRINYTPVGAVDAGDVIVQEDLIGIATTNIAAGELGVLDVEGVFDVAKATTSGSGIDAGSVVYWNPTSEVATETTAGGVYMGKAIADAADADATVRVKLTP